MPESSAPRLLLLSNSTQHGRGYLDHAEATILDFLGSVSRLLFVPFALSDRDAYTRAARDRFGKWGIEVEGLHASADPVAAVHAAEAVFTGGGNTFRLLSEIQTRGLVEPLRARAAAGMPYMGASAGTNLALPSIRTTNDMPIVEPPSFEALGLLPFAMNPHYLDSPTGSTHMGETRETRLREFLEENPGPVLGLREGGWLRREGAFLELGGERPARFFARGADPVEIEPGADLSHLLLGA